MLIRVIDFETTGMPPDAGVCEVGWTDVRLTSDFEAPSISNASSMLVNPKRPMPPEARAVHHIGDADLKGAPPVTTGFRSLTEGYPSAYAAHNAALELEFFRGGETPWICTFKCARRAWPDFNSFNNQFLRYALDLPVDPEAAMPPHRAGPDTHVTAHLLARLLSEHSFDTLIKWTKAPTFYPRLPMTKHKGKLWSEVDYGLLRWFLTADCDADIKAAARAEMKRRDTASEPRF